MNAHLFVGRNLWITEYTTTSQQGPSFVWLLNRREVVVVIVIAQCTVTVHESLQLPLRIIGESLK